MSFLRAVQSMVSAYEANDLDTFFQFVSPDVVWELHASPQSSGVFNKDEIQELWDEFADPTEFVDIERRVTNILVDPRRRGVSFVFEETRLTPEGDTLPLEGIMFLALNDDDLVEEVYNFMDDSQL